MSNRSGAGAHECDHIREVADKRDATAPVVTSAPAGGPATYNTSAPTTTTFVTAGASGLNVEGSVTGLVVFCVLGLFML